jgi:hypothetical protein
MTTIIINVTNIYQLPIHNGKNIRDYVRSELLPALINEPHTQN